MVILSELINDILENNNDDRSDKEYHNYIKYLEMSAYENDLFNSNIDLVAGIDEAGRGPLAGPVVAAAVILPFDYYLPGLNDSKQLSAKKREYYFGEITKHAISIGIGVVSASDIDKYNIYNSAKIAMIKAVKELKVTPKHLLIDAMRLNLDIPETSIIKGDAKSVSIAAASVIAKVTRDNYMKELDKEYPYYNFKCNSGYGTKEHMEAIEKYGVISEHRRSFEPVRSYVEKQYNLFNL